MVLVFSKPKEVYGNFWRVCMNKTAWGERVSAEVGVEMKEIQILTSSSLQTVGEV